MTQPDQHPASLPARRAEGLPARPSYELDEAAPDPHPAGRRITFRLVARAVRRHWWQAMLLWCVGSAGLMTMAYLKVKPTFVAFAGIRVDPGERGIISGGNLGGNVDFAEYKETQVKIITGPNVLGTALAEHPELLNLPRLRLAEDPQAEIRAALNVGIVAKTNLIEIAMTSELPQEATEIVNAVLDAYIKNAADSLNAETENRIKQLRALQAEKAAEVARKRESLKLLQAKIGTTNVAELKGRNSITVEQYTQLNSQKIEVEIRIIEAEARLGMLQNDQPAPIAAEDPKAVQHEVSDRFYSHPRVARVREKFERAVEKYNAARTNVRDPSDPSLMIHVKARRAAEAELDGLWEQLSPRLAAEARAAGFRPGGADAAVREAELQLHALKAQEASLNERLNTLNIQQKKEGVDAMALEFERSDLLIADNYLITIGKSLTDIEFENKNPIARIRPEHRAKASNRPSTSNRLKIMAMAPVGMLCGVLGLLVFLELSAGRVVDPEEVPTRARVPVIGIVPPLPRVRATTVLLSPRDEFRTQRQLDQFVQSLDHLRVALCSGKDPWGRERKCIIITSACGSEGKTTLAAQLAERCVNAGLKILLIDGDLRNPTLSRMLDVPEGRGLINVLRGEVAAEDAMVDVGGAGNFRFMPAGTPRLDPARLLQGERLGRFLTGVRDSFDLVIVDAPPVLPVPDALTIGRWTDGAVLAVRHDVSRFALVEKANRRLASVGVPVIGAVVNGVRIPDSTYGSYYPSYAYADDRGATMPIDE